MNENSRKLPTLWQLRWSAWWEGVPARDLWRIARFYRRLLRDFRRQTDTPPK